jgi:hypothetical protein
MRIRTVASVVAIVLLTGCGTRLAEHRADDDERLGRVEPIWVALVSNETPPPMKPPPSVPLSSPER